MPVTRRGVITIAGGIALGLASAGATGAFDRVAFERDVTITVDGDQSAYLMVRAHTDREMSEYGPEVGTKENGELYIDFKRLNVGSTVDLHNMLKIGNYGDNIVALDIDFLAGGSPVDDVLSIYEEDDPLTPVGTIAPGVVVDVGMQIDASDEAAIDSIETIQFVAESV